MSYAEEDPLVRRMYGVLLDGDIELVRQILKENLRLEFLSLFVIGRTWLHYAAECNGDRTEIVDELVRAGMDVNARCEKSDAGPLIHALDRGNINVARYLLEHGADPNQGRAMIAAVNSGSLELVQLLVEYGADSHQCWPNEVDNNQPMNALGQAMLYGYEDIEAYLRGLGAVEPGSPETESLEGTTTDREDILNHMSCCLGAVQPLALTEIVPGDPPVDIHIFRPEEENGCITLMTCGMSEKPLTVPKGSEDYQYVELKIRLPSDWPLSDSALRDAKFNWPVEWLRRIAYFPHENHTWLGGPSTIIANGEPPKPFASNTKLCCMLLLTDDTQAGQVRCRSGKLITVYSLYPLYAEERAFEMAHGVVELVELLQQHDVPMWVDVKRPNVATGRGKRG